MLYVANIGSNSVSVIDVASRTVLVAIPVGRAPMGVAVAAVPDGQWLESCETPTPTATSTPLSCDGDCDGDGSVEAHELVVGVTIAFGRRPLASCMAVDSDHDGALTIADLVRAVSRGMNGCV